MGSGAEANRPLSFPREIPPRPRVATDADLRPWLQHQNFLRVNFLRVGRARWLEEGGKKGGAG